VALAEFEAASLEKKRTIAMTAASPTTTSGANWPSGVSVNGSPGSPWLRS
jgi:hypothetical protein